MTLVTYEASDSMVIAVKQEMNVMLQVVVCHHVCRYLGVVQLGMKFCIVMELYKESLNTYINHQPGECNDCSGDSLQLGWFHRLGSVRGLHGI